MNTRRLRATVVLAVPTLIVTGLATLGASPAAAAPLPAAAPPAGLESFTVAAGESDRVAPFLTADGQRVVFTSPGSELVSGDTNGAPDVFLSTAIVGSDDPFSGTPLLVSAPDGPIGSVRSDGASFDPVSSADGRYVAFVSAATNLTDDVSTPHAGSWIFVRDTLLDRTFRVQGAENPNGASFAPDLSDDGRYLVFSSNADNLVSGGGGNVPDSNMSTDTYLADLDANSDGVYGDVALTKAFPTVDVVTGTHDAVISGNGTAIALLSRGAPTGGSAGLTTDSLWLTDRSFSPHLEVARNASDPSIDATGTALAYVSELACNGRPTVIASMVSASYMYSLALGTEDTDLRVGRVETPRISAHGGTVAWSTTMPEADPAAVDVPAPLAEPVIRVQDIDWWDATRSTPACTTGFTGDWVEIGEGADPTLSVTGRSIAFQAPDRSAITVADRHNGRGLSTTSVGGGLATPGFMKEVQISHIPISTLREYAGQIANAPVYRLPVYRLPVYRLPVYRLPVYRLLIDDAPVYRLPVYRLPVYRLPVYRLDLPGGWDQILADSPFSGALIQSVTLDEVLDWATGILDDGVPSTAAERAAAERIRSLTLQDLDIDSTGLAGLSLSSYVLGSAPLAQIPIPAPSSAPDAATTRDRWQAVATAQGIDLAVEDDTLLAELDSAGLAIDRTGVEDVALRDLPIARTLLSEIPANRLFLAGTPLGGVDAAALSTASRIALFGTAAVSGTLAAPSLPLLTTGTAADIAAGAPGSVTFGTLLFSLLDAENYPWEEISPSAIDPTLAEASSPGFGCQQNVRCETSTTFRFAFDVGPGELQRGPGEQYHVVAAPTATIDLPAGTRPGSITALGSGPGVTWPRTGLYYGGPVIQRGEHLEFPLPDMRAGTIIELSAFYSSSSTVTRYSASAGIVSGAYRDSYAVADNAPLWAWDDERNNLVDGQWQLSEPAPLQEGRIYYEWISPRSMIYNADTGISTPGPAEDSDFFVVRPPVPGERLVVSTNASDGQIALSLYSSSGAQSAAALGVANAGSAPGTGVAEQSDFSDAAVAGAGASLAVQGKTLIDQAVVRGGDAAEIQAASTDAAGDENLLVRVTSGNGEASSSLYSLRVRYVRDAVETRCAPLDPPDVGDPGSTDPITDETNTLYIFDSTRYAQTYGWEGADAVDAALGSMDGSGAPGQEVHGAVVSVDNDPAVRSARAAYNTNPCSISARKDLTAAINRYVSAQIDGHRDQITSVVIVGGDDILPFAPVPQNTARFTEQDHAADLRRTTTPTGGPCPVDVPADAVDVCATPLSAAAAASSILTDDPYGLATAYESLGGYLYVPTVGLGRILETPAQIQATVARFLAADGAMAADSSVTGGYGAWSELPDLVTDALDWRSADNEELAGTWTTDDVADRLFPDDGSESPRVVSVNTHADEQRMVPGVPGAEEGAVADADLLHADGRTDAAQLAGALVFLIGCHAGNNLPSAYYGDVDDWVDVFSSAGGFVGNTGFGLANNVTTALGERLLAQYAQWVGVEVEGRSVTSAQALTYAKQSYLGGLGLYSGYDEKVLMGTVYYGLPMYTFAPAASGEVKSPPLPAIPDGLTPVEQRGDLLSASLRLQPSFDTVTGGGSGATYLTVDDQAPAVVPGQPVLPRIVSRLDPAPARLVARGAVITALTSTVEDGGTPAVAAAGIGVPEDQFSRADVAFPSTFATVTTQDTPEGPIDLLVVTPARVTVARDGTGSTEKFTDLTVEAVYGPADSTDGTAPAITYVGLPIAGQSTMRFRVDGTGSGIAAVVLLIQRQGDTQWREATVATDGDDRVAEVPSDGSPFRWMLQVVDEAGNVAVDTQRGHLPQTAAAAPALGSAGDDVTVTLGERLVREIEVTDAATDDRLTGTVTVVRGGAVTASGTALLESDDTSTRARIDQAFTTPGAYTVLLEVCRSTSCATTSFVVTVPTDNDAPAAEVRLSANGAAALPTSVLTATATGTDPDGDPVTLTYAWTRNGVAVGANAPTLALGGIASPGDVIAVTVTPHDGKTAGHTAAASILVEVPPAPPTIVATAENTAGSYEPGSWSRSPVTIGFTCRTGVGATVVECPPTRTLSADTTADGLLVEGVVLDSLGRTASTAVLVKVDRTAPALAPTATPSTVVVGGAVVVAPNASDAASGLAAASCAPADTSTPGSKTALCTATDAAGNTARAGAAYTVQPAAPVGPVVSVTAMAGGAPYVAGTWSRQPVQLTYTCTSSVPVTSCPAARTLTADTSASGQVVTATMRDRLGRTASVSITVRIDRTAPTLKPTATPSTVTVGATVVIASGARDAASGISVQSCDAADTATPGVRTATCRATDVAGNSSTGTVTYTVKAPTPATCQGVADRAPLLALNADGSSVFLRTSGVPIVFRACDAAGRSIGTKGYVQGITLVSTGDLPVNAKVNELWYLPIGSFTYVSASKTWLGQIPTAKLASGKMYTYRVNLADGTSFTVTFGVR